MSKWLQSKSAAQQRRHLTPSQTACVAVEALAFYEKEAKERLKEAGEKFGKGMAKMPYAIEGIGKARDFAAKDFKVSARYIQDAKMIKQETPNAFKEIKAGKKKLTFVTKQLKKTNEANYFFAGVSNSFKISSGCLTVVLYPILLIFSNIISSLVIK